MMLAVALTKITDRTRVKKYYDSSEVILALGIKSPGLLRRLQSDTPPFGRADGLSVVNN
jgi:hypothetical protein